LISQLHHSQIRKYLWGYFLYYLPDFFGDSSELGKRSFGCAQLDDMANFAEIPGADYLGLTGIGQDVASNFGFYPLSSNLHFAKFFTVEANFSQTTSRHTPAYKIEQ